MQGYHISHARHAERLCRRVQELEAKLSAERAKVDDLAGKINRMPDWETFEKMRQCLDMLVSCINYDTGTLGSDNAYWEARGVLAKWDETLAEKEAAEAALKEGE